MDSKSLKAYQKLPNGLQTKDVQKTKNLQLLELVLFAEKRETLLVVMSGNMFEPVSTIPQGSRATICTPLEMDWSHSD